MNPPDFLLHLIRRIPPAVRGKRRLARLLFKLFDSEGVRITDRYGCRLELPCATENVSLSLLVDGAYEPEEIGRIRVASR